jgi:hypothetical protein
MSRFIAFCEVHIEKELVLFSFLLYSFMASGNQQKHIVILNVTFMLYLPVPVLRPVTNTISLLGLHAVGTLALFFEMILN